MPTPAEYAALKTQVELLTDAQCAAIFEAFNSLGYDAYTKSFPVANELIAKVIGYSTPEHLGNRRLFGVTQDCLHRGRMALKAQKLAAL